VNARFAVAPPAAALDDSTATIPEVLAVLRANELIEWPADPDSSLLGDCEGWYSAIELGEAAGNPIATWTDESVAGHDLVQATGGLQPTARGAGAGSYVEFDGTVYVQGSTASDWAFLHSSDWAIAAVIRSTLAGTSVCLATWNGSDTDGTSLEVLSGGAVRLRSRYNAEVTSVQSAAGVVSANVWTAVLSYRIGNIITVEVDGVVVASKRAPNVPAATNPGNALRVGGLGGGGGLTPVDVADLSVLSGTYTRHQLDAMNYKMSEVRDGL
jgi:hypothetical protein